MNSTRVNFATMLVVLCSCMLGPSLAGAIECVPYADVRYPSSAELQRLNIKLTHVGYRIQGDKSCVLRPAGAPVDVGASFACRKPDIDYNLDVLGPAAVSIDSVLFRAALDSLASLPTLTDGGIDSAAFLSLSIIDANGMSSRVFEAVVDDSSAALLFFKLRQAVATNDSAIAVLGKLACRLGVAEAAVGNDVTNSVEVTLSGARFRRSDGLYVARIKVRNTSGTSIPAPASVLLRFNGLVRPVGPNGFGACTANPPGAPYFVLPIGSSLAPGGSVQLTLGLDNPGRQLIRLNSARVVQGLGPP